MDNLNLRSDELNREYAEGMTTILNRKAMIILNHNHRPVLNRQIDQLDAMLDRGVNILGKSHQVNLNVAQ